MEGRGENNLEKKIENSFIFEPGTVFEKLLYYSFKIEESFLIFFFF